MVKALIFLVKTSVTMLGFAAMGIMIDTHAYYATEHDSFLIEHDK